MSGSKPLQVLKVIGVLNKHNNFAGFVVFLPQRVNTVMIAFQTREGMVRGAWRVVKCEAPLTGTNPPR